MNRTVFVTGGSGFVGSAVIAALLERGCSVRALVNQASIPDRPGLTSITGGLFDDAALARGLQGCDAVVHLVGIIAERPSRGITFERMHHQATVRVVAAAQRGGVRRYLHMSALGARPDAPAAYHRTKFAAEQAVRAASSLDWTIFRPSLIHGPRGEFMQTEARWARGTAPPFFAMPYFGAGLLGHGGAGMLQPVFVDDVARAFAEALDRPPTVGRSYDLGGEQRVTWPQLHHISAAALVGHARPVLPFPVPAARLLARLGVANLLGFTRDQVEMSQEDNTCDLTPFVADFGWTPPGFAASLSSYAAQL